MATVLMSIEGVLTEDLPQGADLLRYESSPQGRTLYQILHGSSRLVLLSQDPHKERVQAWLARERFAHYADVHCYPADSLLTPALWRVQHLQDLMGVGHHISFYVDCDPTSIGMALEAGIGALFVGRPGDAPSKQDDMGYQAWYSLVETIEAQNMRRAAKSVEANSG